MIETLSLVYIDVVTATGYKGDGLRLRIVCTVHRVLICTPSATSDLELIGSVVFTEVNHTLVYCISTCEIEDELVRCIVSPAVV